ncbi:MULTISPECIES: nitroreductase [Rhodococcus]|uniref:Nitroreductase n=1 Tax=Rhodococcus oxybenzonivorans TaxID=1990687 RepID=A0AAE4UXF1_9NOCA|nr:MULTISPECIES: nitroreductase [Rhodococcus]MDV7246524.1 nitroreductase [Rhodococcus oxybenzonivorans]MDV7264520.1 nitroreductase [Rhodococcus oxybenzonivorans]MDV7278146.1 nitroreductase [Rhodococcus oxybenzonivorans]MDV7337541.1 nitroreductase [Rhodococcus oxybenzonivorans]MDV7347734.1 nitroreductase [Rhodococcus oxybenzonivorans]
MTDTGIAAPDTNPAAGIFATLLDERISCRAFLPRQVPRQVIERILELAQQTPSWCNTQPWQVAITEGEGTERFRTGLAEYVRSHPQESDFDFPREYRGEHKLRRRECAMQLYSSVGIAPGDRAASAEQTMKNFDLFGAPHVAIVTTHEALGTYGAVDCGLYVDSFLLAAQSLGVATIPQAALAGSSPYIRDFFSLSEERKVVCGVSFGYADTENPVNQFRTHRESVDNVVEWVSQ